MNLKIHRQEGAWAQLVSYEQGTLVVEVYGTMGCPEADHIMERVNSQEMLLEAAKAANKRSFNLHDHHNMYDPCLDTCPTAMIVHAIAMAEEA